jgi:hypothetical protein
MDETTAKEVFQQAVDQISTIIDAPGTASRMEAAAASLPAMQTAASDAAASADTAANAAAEAAASATEAAASADSVGSAAADAADSATAAANSASEAAASEATVAASALTAAANAAAATGTAALATLAALALVVPANGMARMLTTSGKEGVFVFDGSNLSAKVAADPNHGIYQPPAAATGLATDGSQGAWRRVINGAPMNPEWWGVIRGANGGLNRATNSAAFQAMLTTLRARSIPPSGVYRSIEPIKFPAGDIYEFAGDDDIMDAACLIEGTGPAYTAMGTKLDFPDQKSGFRIQGYNTSGDVTTGRNGQNATCTTLRNMWLKGGYTTAGGESEHHGVWIKAAFVNLENVWVTDFPGDGIYANASAPVIADTCRITGGGAVRNRRGIFVDGGDVNVWLVQQFLAGSNRTWGIFDSSFLGNTYIACQTQANGWDGAIGTTPTACTYLGNRYSVIPGQEVWCSTNSPTGTTAHNQGWHYISAGGTYNGIIAWANGATFRSAGGYYCDSPNATNNFFGCYTEGDQNPNHIAYPSIWWGGIGGNGFDTPQGTAQVNGTTISGVVNFGSKEGGGVGTSVVGGQSVKMYGNNVNNQGLGGIIEWDGLHQLMRLATGANNDLVFTKLSSAQAPFHAFTITLENTTNPCGANRMTFPNGFGFGTTGSTKKWEPGTAAPTTGYYPQGSIVWNQNASATAPLAWSCTVGGWIASTAWAPSHVYVLGDLVTNDTGKSYRCIVGGTSAAAGGPTGTGNNIADGTASWAYSAGFTFLPIYGQAAVALTFANLPAAPVVGQRSFITDCTVNTFGTAAAGGGTNKVPVYYDGAWKVG